MNHISHICPSTRCTTSQWISPAASYTQSNQDDALPSQSIIQLYSLILMSEELQNEKPNATNFTDQELRKFDFSKLPPQQLQLLEELTFFSTHQHMYKVLVDEIGQGRQRQQYILQNLGYIPQEDSADFAVAKRKYVENSYRVPTIITSFCTIGAFGVGLWTLPSRVSTFKYTMGGMVVGLVFSYGYWRYALKDFNNTVNKHFKTIIREKYIEGKRGQ